MTLTLARLKAMDAGATLVFYDGTIGNYMDTEDIDELLRLAILGAEGEQALAIPSAPDPPTRPERDLCHPLADPDAWASGYEEMVKRGGLGQCDVCDEHAAKISFNPPGKFCLAHQFGRPAPNGD